MPPSQTIKVALFDLNQTVYNKSSKDEFYKYICYKRNYKLLDLLQMGWYTLKKELNIINKTEFKENFFQYLDKLPPAQVEEYAAEYWSIEWPKHFNPALLKHISSLQQSGVKIIFITGALDLYVKPLFEHYLVPDYWIATRTQYSRQSYAIIGKACKNEEKLKRLQQMLHPQLYEIVEAYSDSKENMLEAAQQAFLLKEGKIIPIDLK